MSRQGLPPDVLRKIAKISDLDTKFKYDERRRQPYV